MAEQRARVDDDNLMDGIHIDLRPVEWIQTISTNSIAAREGRGLIVNCKVKDDHVVLSNERRLHHLSVNLSIIGGPPTRGDGKPLERGIGVFSFHDDIERRNPWDKPFYACVSGWFCLKPDSYADLWEQVRDGGYSDCLIDIRVAPVGSKGFETLWDVEAHRHLFILGVSVRFTRKVFEEKKAVEEAAPRWSLFARR
jgi:hypothetical protein